jgi:heterodisulfide reductase subunit C2
MKSHVPGLKKPGTSRLAGAADLESSLTMATVRKVEELAHTRVPDCYQCGKCSAGCPVADRMDLMPNQVVRLVQTGRLEKALRSQSIWLCVSCQTCTTRCPKSVDCAALMDALRQLAFEEGLDSPALQRTVVFQEVFLNNIRRNGRLNELELVGSFKTRSFLQDISLPFLFKDAMLAPKMMARSKFHLMGEKVRDRALVGRIFERCEGDRKF